MQSDQVKSLINDFELTHFEPNKVDINKAVCMFNNIIETAAKTSLQLARTKTSKSKNSQIWFDRDCRAFRLKLKKTANRLHKNPFNINTRTEYHYMTKQYKGLLRYKRKTFDNDIIQSLVKEKNTKQFWSTLKSASNTNTINERTVPVDNLLNHFNTLHSNIDENYCTPNQKIIIDQTNIAQSNQTA